MSRQEGRERVQTFEKLKSFFRLNKVQGVSRTRSDECIVLTDDLVAELQPGSALSNRLRASKELLEHVQSRQLESFSVEKLWNLLKDLLQPEVPRDARHLVLALFTCICRNQVEKSGAIRAKFFAFIQSHDLPEDSGQRFEFLKALSKDGRDISDFNERIGPFLRSWMSNSQNVFVNTKDCMSFLINVIKFNQSVLDVEVLDEIIQNVCFICCTSSVQEDVLECLNVLSAVICYPSLPQNSLQTFLATLCRTVNVEYLCQASWKIMRDLLGTHMGHSGLLQMCEFMETADVSEEVAVIRGAVFFVGAVLWGSRMVRSLKYSPSTVLAAFKKALERKHHYISHEVMMRVQDLVRNKGDMLQSVSWDLILEIIEKVLEYSRPDNARDEGHSHKIIKCVNETLDIIEGAISSGGFCGSTQRFYAVVDAGVKFRPESSVCKLLQYKMHQFLRTTRPGWFNNLIAFAERHYRLETRPSIKVIALGHITKVCLANRDTHEEDLIDKVIFPFMKNLETETDLLVRQQGVNFIVEFMLDSTAKKGHDLLHILERIVNRPFEATSSDMVNIFSEKEVVDVATGIEGLIKIFNRKIYHLPSSIAILAYNIIVRNLTQHYKKPAALEECYHIRLMIFECFFKIRANSMYHLGFPDSTAGSVVNYCAYLAVDHRDGELVEGQPGSGHETPAQGNSSSPSTSTQQGGGNSSGSSPGSQNQSTTLPQVTYISLTQACKLVVSSLKKEKDWRVLELILRQIPNVMENKALILAKHGNDIDYLANAMCTMMMEKSFGFPDSLRNVPPKFQRSDLQSYMYPILTSLVSYHSHLDSTVQSNIVKCLEHGLVSRNPRICILALSTCTLEMKDTMHKLLPQVLLSLSKITPKVNIAIPVLEFLSTLIHLPRVFASFVQDQYMSIFAIALPYTNPFKFNQYTVSLAHHVIAMWFLKCRLSFRRGFVSYIIKGLEANVWTPFEEETRRNALELQNEDSSNRKRSSSLTEQSNKRRERPISGHTGAPGPPQTSQGPRASHAQLPDLKPIANKALMTFHQELTETCVDLMARYAFADCSALPTRFPSTNFLLAGGHSQTWLIDNKIITITTSGCTQKELREGLCDKCWLLCRKPSPVVTNPGNTGSEDEGGEEKSFLNAVDSSSRRRHRSAFAGTKKNEEQADAVDGSEPKAKDDLHLEHKLQMPHSRASGGDETTGGLMTDWTPKQKSDNKLCTCWCQGWAEIHIRRPTGNTSWMMRVQNQIGNHAGADLPLRELSAMFLRNPDLEKYSQQASSGIPSGSHTPAHPASIPNSGTGSPTRSTYLSEAATVPSTPPSPKSPVPGSPTEPRGIPMDTSGRTLVRRSNSSPEMSDSMKPGFISQQNLIQEQDEDELSLSSKSVLENSSSETNLSFRDEKRPEEVTTLFKQMERPSTLGSSSSHMTKGGSTSPFRRSYEAIPEEVLSLKDTIHPLLAASPSKREKLQTQHSADDTMRSRASSTKEKVSSDMPPVQRDRTFTISVMSPAVRNKGLRRILSAGSSDASSMSMNRRDFDTRSGSESSNIRSGMSPSFVFLQLCAQGMFGQGTKPLLLTPKTENSIKVLDYIQPFETHKIGVVYVGPGQATSEAAILQNMYGSARFRDFLKCLGTLVKLRGVDPQKTYIGGLSSYGDDGEFAIIWQDDVMQVMFHVPTLMPNKENDPACNAKKRHIGNDFVSIIYNNSGEDFDISTIKGQFLYACVIVEPLDHGTNRVLVKAKPVLADQIGHTEPKIVSDQNLPIMVRQLALHSNLASVIFDNAQREGAAPYASNWLERLRKIKQLRLRLTQELGSTAGNSEETAELNTSSSTQQKRPFTVDDFTDFV